jgi:hypothetical protein
MSAAVLDRPPVADDTSTTTLESVVVRVWEDLIAHGSVACLVCGGRMKPRYGASGMSPVGGRCADCGSTLG